MKILDWIPFEKINWFYLFQNPNIFTYDYKANKNDMYKEGGIADELMKKRFHPKNMDKWNGWGFFKNFYK